MTEKKRGRGWTLAGIVLLAAALRLPGYNLASDLRGLPPPPGQTARCRTIC